MDRAALERQLRVAKAHVALDLEHVRDLQRMVSELEDARKDTGEVKRLLKNCLELEA
jgi:hypothetical protein